jgi:hypothetical protein
VDASRRGVRRGRIGRDVGRTDSIGRPRLLGGILGHYGCKAFLFFEFLARQGMQVLKILLPKSEGLSFRKEERGCFVGTKSSISSPLRRDFETRRLSPGRCGRVQ